MRRVCIWVEEKDVNGMKWVSKRTSVPVSALMRQAIEEFVRTKKEKVMQTREGSLGIIRYASTVASVPEEYDVTFARYDYSLLTFGGAAFASFPGGRSARVSADR